VVIRAQRRLQYLARTHLLPGAQPWTNSNGLKRFSQINKNAISIWMKHRETALGDLGVLGTCLDDLLEEEEHD